MSKHISFFLALFTFFSALSANNNQDEANFSSMDVRGENPSTLTNLEAEPSSSIYNAVSVISGDYTESFMDFMTPGPDVIPIQRVYSSGERSTGSLCYGWHLGKYGLLNRWKADKKDGKGYRATIVGNGGSRMTYAESGDS
jgi:hypothetical protein